MPGLDIMNTMATEDVKPSEAFGTRPRRACRNKIVERLTYATEFPRERKTSKVRTQKERKKPEKDFSEGYRSLSEDEGDYLIEIPQDEDISISGKQGLATLWEFSCVLDFLAIFWNQLGMEKRGISFTSADLESALEAEIDSDEFKLLIDIHVTLLLGIHPRSRDPPSEHNWVHYLIQKATKRWEEIGVGPNPLEAAEDYYENLSPSDRLSLLRFLCEVRAEVSDIRQRLDKAHSNTHKSKKAKEAEKEQEGIHNEYVQDFRRQVLGYDHYRRKYWLIMLPADLGLAWLCRERRTTDACSRINAASRYGSKARPPLLPSWQVVCQNANQLKEFIGKIDASLFGAEMRRKFRNDILLEIDEILDKEERRKKAEARLVAQGLYVTDINEGRGRRKRKAVSYAEDDHMYDQMVEAAIKEQQGRSVRKARFETYRYAGRSMRSWSDDSVDDALDDNITSPQIKQKPVVLEESPSPDVEEPHNDGIVKITKEVPNPVDAPINQLGSVKGELKGNKIEDSIEEKGGDEDEDAEISKEDLDEEESNSQKSSEYCPSEQESDAENAEEDGDSDSASASESSQGLSF